MRDMNNKERRRFKIVFSRKSNGKIDEFVLTSDFDAAIIDFKNDYHHGDVDVVGLERCK